MQHVVDKEDTLNIVSYDFVNTTNEIISIYEQFPNNFKLQDEFSIILMRIYQGFMWENFRSAQLLVADKKFFSFSILCRSMLDIIVQITWILSLESPKKEQAIKCFLEFDGVYITKNGKHVYEWQYFIDPDYSMRKAAIEVGLDRKILSWPVERFFDEKTQADLPSEKKHLELHLTAFDYLSKVSHWNPRFLSEITGVNKEKHLGYTAEYLRMCIISLNVFISCSVIFSEIFCDHFFEDKNNNLGKLQEIKNSFAKKLSELFDLKM